MGNPSQSQDVEHKGPRSNPLDSRPQPHGSSEQPAQNELGREAEPNPEQQEGDDSKLSQHGTNTPSRPD